MKNFNSASDRETDENDAPPVYIIPSLKKACQIMKFLGSSTRTFSCLEISRKLNFPRTTTLRILESLVSENFASKDGSKYSIGFELSNLGDCSLARSNLSEIAPAVLEKLTKKTGETSHLGVLSGDKILIANVCKSPLPLHAESRSGSLVDMHCSGTGKAVLSIIVKTDPDIIKKLKLSKRTRHTITEKNILLKELAISAKRGYALDNEEYHDSVRCLAVPILDKSSRAVGAIGITAPAVRFIRKRNAEIFEKVKTAVNEIEKKLGVKI